MENEQRTNRPIGHRSGRGAARHAARAVTPTWKLMLRFGLRFEWEYLLRFPSNYAWMVLRRKYDAFTTDRAYDERPSSWLGPLGWWADRRVLNFPLHVALRDRLRNVTEALVGAIERHGEQGARTVRVLSAPCGLCRDLIQTAQELQRRGLSLPEDVELHALDLDSRGDVIPEGRRRGAAARVPIAFYREDLFDPAGLRARAEGGLKFDVVNCIGLTAWLDLADTGRLVTFFREAVMEPRATLLIDNFAPHEHSAMGEDLEIYTYYHPPEAFRRALEDAGLRIIEERVTPNRVNTLWIAERAG